MTGQFVCKLVYIRNISGTKILTGLRSIHKPIIIAKSMHHPELEEFLAGKGGGSSSGIKGEGVACGGKGGAGGLSGKGIGIPLP